jgi:hypothetical protein
MKFKLIVAPKARDDIIRNASWWAENHSHEQSDRYWTVAALQLFQSSADCSANQAFIW